MIRVAFLLNFPLTYKGGINYLKNLFYAISTVKRKKVEIYLFVPDGIDQEYIDAFSPFATIVKTKILTRRDPQWFIDKISERIFHYNILLNQVLRKYQIDVISHSNYVSKNHAFKVLNWIPDFQSMHYPHLWTPKALKNNFSFYHKLIKRSDLVILSSNSAFDDYKNFSKTNEDKVRVLQFVSQPENDLGPQEMKDMFSSIKSKYNIENNFFYLPNQFWQHKNHIVVFKAVKILKDRGVDIKLVTSGQMGDYRVGEEHINMLTNFVSQNKLDENILLLGLIPYREVLVMMQSCTALINPSLFEGWSSTVEEAKSIAKTIVLSNIPVHREQSPSKGIFFDPHDAEALADILLELWQNLVTSHNSDDLTKSDLYLRTISFANNYHGIIEDAMKLPLKTLR
ncbi:glycosyltransferase family 1 protein [Pedobacter sp. P351]|uniref:glycosyltransferase family 4 protein n=1 Tax=Pedobacter superstes TaxID=3133441 RepID=UPI0030977A41